MSIYANIPDATVVVGSWSSACNNCGQATVNFEEHDEVSGYGPKRPGCGIKFTHITAEYGEMHEQVAREMAPDLTYIDIREVLHSGSPAA